MIVNFRAHGISRGTRKLIQTPILIKKKEEDTAELISIITVITTTQPSNQTKFNDVFYLFEG